MILTSKIKSFLSGTGVKESKGREEYMKNNFFRGVLGLRVKNMIIDGAIIKTVFQLSPEKKRLVFAEFIERLSSLKG